MWTNLFEIVSIVLSLVGIVYAFYMFNLKIRAEKNFEKLIRQHQEILTSIERQKQLDDKMNLTEMEFQKLKLELLSLAESLPKDQKEEIVDALDQKSRKGQLSYVKKVLSESGSTKNIKVSN